MAEGLRLEDWIDKKVTVNILRTPSDDPDEEGQGPYVGIEGFLNGVDPMGIILLFDPQDVVERRGPVRPLTVTSPRHVFFPWSRIHLVERIEDKLGEDESQSSSQPS
ncbi:MAG: hypothetical protein M3R38_16985 [Actinomycetota bacterium]|nr:hypothetical protein [Actinomycetota bacterium]